MWPLKGRKGKSTATLRRESSSSSTGDYCHIMFSFKGKEIINLITNDLLLFLPFSFLINCLFFLQLINKKEKERRNGGHICNKFNFFSVSFKKKMCSCIDWVLTGQMVLMTDQSTIDAHIFLKETDGFIKKEKGKWLCEHFSASRCCRTIVIFHFSFMNPSKHIF